MSLRIVFMSLQGMSLRIAFMSKRECLYVLYLCVYGNVIICIVFMSLRGLCLRIVFMSLR